MLPRTIGCIQRLALRPIQPVTIQQLLSRSALVSDEEHVRHAQWIHQEMPVRLAHRLQDFMRLPFVVVCNTRFHEVFRLFLHSFETLVHHRPPANAEETAEFALVVKGLVRGHADIVHMLQEGYGELQALFEGLVDLDEFLNQTFFTRIGNRVLAEHFLAVHEARMRGDTSECYGVVHPRLCPAEIVRKLGESLGVLCGNLYGVEPTIVLEGDLDTELSFVPDHLSFILQEIIKNAFRATIERHKDADGGLPPVTVEVMKGSFDVTMKVSDRGGGMRREKVRRIWRYGYTSTKQDSAQAVADAGTSANDTFSGLCGQDPSSMRQLAGYGFGIPLSRVYAKYFGGDIHVQSMHGYGTDVYLNINHLGHIREYNGLGPQPARLAAS